MKVKRVISAVCFFIALAAALPLLFGCKSEGVLASLLFAVLGILLFSPKPLDKLTEKCRWVKTLLLICCSFAVAVCLVISVLMTASLIEKPNKEAKTVIVLGCQVQNGEPSEMLKRRLDTAIKYLNEHSECSVIVSGAMGKGEDSFEADVMYNYVIDSGIEVNRVYKDSKALRTKENLFYSAKLIEQEGLDKSVIIVSDAFHQYRAGCFARRYGLAPSPLSSETPFFVFVTYWFREILAVLRMYILNY